MYKKQVRLFDRGYIINDNENEAETEHRYDIKRHRLRHGHKYTKYKIYLNIMMVIQQPLFPTLTQLPDFLITFAPFEITVSAPL